jgi:hypothetical protein
MGAGYSVTRFFNWSEMLADIVTDLRSVEHPSVREIAFRARAGQRRWAERFFNVSIAIRDTRLTYPSRVGLKQ